MHLEDDENNGLTVLIIFWVPGSDLRGGSHVLFKREGKILLVDNAWGGGARGSPTPLSKAGSAIKVHSGYFAAWQLGSLQTLPALLATTNLEGL